FGAFKRRFKILHHPPEFPIETQARFVLALASLFNFIRTWDPSDIDLEDTDEEPHDLDHGYGGNHRHMEDDVEADPIFGGVSNEETQRATIRRDEIAQKMWEEYCRY
ncbi:hypothetical protein F5878DRAFT_495632, partial [Lentinula raphanica]